MIDSSLAQLIPFGRVARPMFIFGSLMTEVKHLEMSMNCRPTKAGLYPTPGVITPYCLGIIKISVSLL